MVEKNPLPAPVVAAEPVETKIYAYHYLRATATTSSGKPALWQNELSFGKPDTHEFIRNVTPLYASPLVRGDREAIARLILKKFLGVDDFKQSTEEWDTGCLELADAILSLPIQPGAEYV